MDLHELDDTSGYIWQGFQHTWNRKVLGFFRTPHRISNLSSQILNEHHSFDQKSLNFQHEAQSDLFQSTGVDGDWMRPVMHYGIFHSPGLEVRRGQLHVEFTDELNEKLNASTRIEGTFSFTTNTWITNWDPITESVIHVFSLKTKCIEPNPEVKTCNSNGIWPYRLTLGLKNCKRKRIEPFSDQVEFTCGYRIEVGRAWTPRKGGLPPIEVKPLNQKTQYQVDLGVQILSGPPSNFSAQRIRYEGHKLNPRDRDPLQRSIPGRIAGSGNNQYPSAMIGFREVGFEFQEKGNHSEWSMGRYLSGVGLSVTADSYDPATGFFDFTLLSGFTLPTTVKNAWLKVSSELTLLQFANREPQQVLNAQEEGLICINSTHEAPLFSRWKKCEKIAPQQEQ
jgi:hypothetical protein